MLIIQDGHLCPISAHAACAKSQKNIGSRFVMKKARPATCNGYEGSSSMFSAPSGTNLLLTLALDCGPSLKLKYDLSISGVISRAGPGGPEPLEGIVYFPLVRLIVSRFEAVTLSMGRGGSRSLSAASKCAFTTFDT